MTKRVGGWEEPSEKLAVVESLLLVCVTLLYSYFCHELQMDIHQLGNSKC